MRISVAQLRSIILVVNLVLAGSLVWKALAAYDVIDLVFGEGVTVESHPARVDLRKFVYVPESFPEQPGPSRVTRVATDLQPPKPALPSLDKPEPVVADNEAGDQPASEDELPEGPLAKDWEYVYYIAWQGEGETGVRNFAQIRKKQEDKSKGSRFDRTRISSRASSSLRNRPSTRARGASSASKLKGKEDSVSFLVSDRRIQNEELDLDFWVHSADRDKLVYWMPGRPGTRYALPYKHEGSYLAQGPIRKELRPEDDGEEEGEEEEKKSFYIIQEDADPETAREKRYEEISAGKSSETGFSPSSGKSSKAGTRASPEAESGSSPGAGESRLRPGAGRGAPAKPTQEDIKELKSAIDKIPKEERETLRKELQGMIQGKK